jgi:hypothetical protein
MVAAEVEMEPTIFGVNILNLSVLRFYVIDPLGVYITRPT